jgi:hypothetical protein
MAFDFYCGFTNACDNKFSCNMVSDNIQETNTTLTKELINIAGDYIPVKKFNNKNQKPCVPWWDQNFFPVCLLGIM